VLTYWLLILEEIGITLKEEIMADIMGALSHPDIHNVKIQEKEAQTLLSESGNNT
jgi:hypothetical protein